MADTLAIYSVYRQLEGLEQAVTTAPDVRSRFEMCFTHQGSFNQMRQTLIDEAASVSPAFVKSFEHIGGSRLRRKSGSGLFRREALDGLTDQGKASYSVTL